MSEHKCPVGRPLEHRYAGRLGEYVHADDKKEPTVPGSGTPCPSAACERRAYPWEYRKRLSRINGLPYGLVPMEIENRAKGQVTDRRKGERRKEPAEIWRNRTVLRAAPGEGHGPLTGCYQSVDSRRWYRNKPFDRRRERVEDPMTGDDIQILRGLILDVPQGAARVALRRAVYAFSKRNIAEAENARLREIAGWAEMMFRRNGEGHIECFERINDAYMAETGYMRPGKSYPMESPMSSEEQQERWDAWIASKLERLRAALKEPQ